MQILVLVLLPLVVLAVFGVVVAAVLEVAFTRPHSTRRTLASAGRWQPPLVHGEELFTWAVNTATAATASRLARSHGPETARQLAQETYAGLNHAISRLPGATIEPAPSCASCRHQMIGVTPPEVLAIADTIRTTRLPREVKRIHDRAVRNVAAIEQIDRDSYEQARAVCPLFLLADGSCAAFDARPIQCRGRRLVCGSELDDGAPEESEAVAIDRRAQTIGSGAEAGLSRGLVSAGLDGTVYELNSALVAALDTPDATDRWTRGLPVFELCKRYE